MLRMQTECGSKLISSWMPFATQSFLVPMESGSEEKLPNSQSIIWRCATRYWYSVHRYWENGIKTCTQTCQNRFIDTFQLYLNAVAQRAIDRDQQHIRGIDHYFELRRDTMGFKPAFAIVEAKMDIPDEVMNHPSILTISAACGDLMAIANDLYSYNVEWVLYLTTFFLLWWLTRFRQASAWRWDP